MKKEFMIQNRYLLIPVKNGQPTSTVSFFCEGKKIYEFEIPMAQEDETYGYDVQSPLPVEAWNGKTVTVEGDVQKQFLDAIVPANQMPESGCKRPLRHFAPESGWVNDPCGLLYDKGTYHLYFQHNPFSVEWGNMSWGHAVSTDLLHWEQKEDALWPDEDGTIFTGSAVVNEQGLFDLPKDAQLYVYTSAGSSSKWSAGKKFVQKLAWSTDGGKTLNKTEGCILDHIAADNRDMKVYWQEEKQQYFAVIFLEGNEYAILVSRDLKNWEVTQKLTLPDAWECPDLLKLQTDDGKEKWVFWTADGYYFVGDFDGSRFTHDGVRREAYQSMLPYAAQTFNGPDRVISVAWLRTDNSGKVRRGMMGIPRQLTLAVQDGAYVLRQKPVDEFEQAKVSALETKLQETVLYEQKEPAVVVIDLIPKKNVACTVDIYGTRIMLQGEKLTICGVASRSNGVKEAVKLGDKEKLTSETQDYRVLELKGHPEKISLISDGEVLEVIVNDGLISDAFETCVDEKTGMIRAEAAGAVEMKIFTVK